MQPHELGFGTDLKEPDRRCGRHFFVITSPSSEVKLAAELSGGKRKKDDEATYQYVLRTIPTLLYLRIYFQISGRVQI